MEISLKSAIIELSIIVELSPIEKILRQMAINYAADINGSDFLSFISKPDSLTRIIAEYYAIVPKNEEEEDSVSAQNAKKCKKERGMHLTRYLNRRIKLRNDGIVLDASFVDGYDFERKYICIKSLQEDDCDKFWQAVSNYKVQIIVVMSRLSDKKCYQYWSPKEGCVKVSDKFRIKTLEINIKPHFNLTLLSLTDKFGREQKISHYQYTAWPGDNFSHNPDAFIDFYCSVKDMCLQLERQTADKKIPPIIVQCLDGIVSTKDFLKRRTQPNCFKLIRDEYYSIMSRPMDKAITSFMKPENELKNRYSDIPCWEHSRVVLDTKEGSNYIHANWIDGFEEPKKFIATQGPLANTAADFWRLVWQQCCYVIVMLTPTKVSGGEKCYQYWCVRENGSLDIDDFRIKTLKVTARNNYVRTLIEVTDKSLKTSRKLSHFQCSNWFEFNTPSDLPWFVHFTNMIDRVRRVYMELLEPKDPLLCPIVVHCSAGVGRTGTFCAVDICLNQVVKTSEICIPNVVFNVREQRYAGVMSFKQYSFIYEVLHYFLSVQKNVDKPSFIK
ncbi:protein tyrosine phosphatase [Cotesia vestalis bracovirus]|nr:protein tyrosine phosphatase [Cotesia vestalis bracovirus]